MRVCVRVFLRVFFFSFINSQPRSINCSVLFDLVHCDNNEEADDANYDLDFLQSFFAQVLQGVPWKNFDSGDDAGIAST